MARNILYVVQGHDHPALFSQSLVATDPSWISGKPPHTHWVYAAKTRYRQADAECRFAPVDGGFRLDFAQPQWAVTPGQSAVLYDGEVCLGGGVIAMAEALDGVPA